MNIANIISSFRIIFSLVLLSVMNSKPLFISLYLIVGLSDIVDGYIARKYNMVTQTGAMLDSIADLVFYAVILALLFLKYEWVIYENLLLFVIALIIRVLTMVVSKIKFGKVVFIHTIANKITGLLVFFAIPLILIGVNGYLAKVVFVVAILSSSEEFCIVVRNKEINLNQKSFF